MKKIRLGVILTARDSFPPRKMAAENGVRIRARLKSIFEKMPFVECIWAEHLMEDGMVTEIEEAEKAAEYFREQRIDALFVPHANFGQEEAVGIIANALRLPILIWGPRDGRPDETMVVREQNLTDTQCGLFATTRLLMRYGIPYTYLRNCWLESEELERGIMQFVQVASVVKQFRNLRILQLSTRPRQFLSVKVNEGELLERFGIHVVPVESTEIVSRINYYIEEKDMAKALLKKWSDEKVTINGMDDIEKLSMAAIVLAIQDLAEKYRCSAVASECWSLLRSHFKVPGCFAFGYLSQMGLPVACETDIHGAISSVLAQAAALYETPSFLADITVRHPQNDNAELLWHCGPFPYVLSKDRPCVNSGKGQYELKNGELTLVRFDTDHDEYYLLAEECETTNGPATDGNYVWIQTQDWGKWEDKLMYGPYIHHIAGVYGSYKAVFHEACKYMGIIHDHVF